MNKILFLITILLLITNLDVHANTDVIYLKNGSVIKGSIMSIEPKKSVKIEIPGGNVFVFMMDEVEHIEKEVPAKSNYHSIEHDEPVDEYETLSRRYQEKMPRSNSNLLISFSIGGGYNSYIDDEDFKISEEFESDGTPSFQLKGALDYIPANSGKVAIGAELNLSYISDEISKSYLYDDYIDDYYDGYHVIYNSYFTDYKNSFTAIPVSVNLKMSLLPLGIVTPYFGLGLTFNQISNTEKGVYYLETPYDDTMTHPFDVTVTKKSNQGYNGFCGMNINLNKTISLFGEFRYVHTKVDEKFELVSHEDVRVSDIHYNWYSYEYIVLKGVYLGIPEANYDAWTINFGTTIFIGKNSK